MREMAILSQAAHKCVSSWVFPSRFSFLRSHWRGSLGSLRSELGFTTLESSGYGLGCRRRSGRFLVTASEGKNIWEEVTENGQQQRLLQVVLVSPQIAVNSGSIARTCAATRVGLHLVEPLGYKIDESKLKSAGLEYWPHVVVKVHKSWNDFFTYFEEQDGEKRLLAFTKNGREVHTDVKYKAGDWLLFGSEVDGLPAAALEQCKTGQYAGGTVRLPMNETYVRSLNLSVSAGIGVYEALRQIESSSDYSSLDAIPGQAVFSGKNDGYP
ncbi:hypothetical protein KC19_12G053300 [Ceratodon purpureus]|uniref:tRNA/rRNA methyltransferase SpoU type domain-containing protein n=1 Tax=Ceratodon purpureus TaxID=3225 RepID=A0A8T0G7H3_CERPU|nr:hypothetical protein KC19_12G053300 [Ceratodon purpureus]